MATQLRLIFKNKELELSDIDLALLYVAIGKTQPSSIYDAVQRAGLYIPPAHINATPYRDLAPFDLPDISENLSRLWNQIGELYQ